VADDLLDDVPEADFPAAANTPGQAESRAARNELQRWLAQQTDPPAWYTLWNELRDEQVIVAGPDGQPALDERGNARTRRRWDWRKALYIAWSCVPKASREPKTIEELCSLLGLASTGTIRNWRRKDPGLAERIAELPRSLLLNHVADVYDALVSVASTADPKAFNDRRLFLELVGQYAPKGAVMVSGPEGGAVPVDLTYGLAELSDEELDALDRIAGRIAGAGG
jgi:hypothetical protein